MRISPYPPAYGRSPAHDTLPALRTMQDAMLEVIAWPAELRAQGLWPVPQGVTLYRTADCWGRPYWRFLPDPAAPRVIHFNFSTAAP